MCCYCAVSASLRTKDDMHPPNALGDDTVARLRALATQLQERLADAERIRARFTRARAANVWPDLSSRSPLLTQRPDSRVFVERGTRSRAN